MASAAAFSLDGDLVVSAGVNLDDEFIVRGVRIPTGRVAAAFNPGFALISAGPGRLELEVPVMWSGSARLVANSVPLASVESTWSVIPGARFRIAPGRRLSPFAMFGVGVAHASDYRIASRVVLPEIGATRLALGYGAGLDLRVIGPLKLRGELRSQAVRFSFGEASSWENRPLFMAGLGFTF